MTKGRRRDNQTCTSSHRERTLSGLQTWREGSTFLSAEAKNARHITVSGMEPLETQPDPELKPAYFDPDTPDISEQQFAASLEAEIEKPAFVVDTVEAAANARSASPPSELILEGQASRPSAADATINDAQLLD